MDTNQNPTTMASSSSDHLPSVATTITTTERKPRKKCHGNKKLQRFRKRRRARGMSEAAINKTIEARQKEKEKQETKKRQQQQQQQQQPNVGNQIQQTSVITSTKRKRDVSFQDLNRHSTTTTSTLLNQQITTNQLLVTKKMKKSTSFIQSLPINSISVNKNYPYVFHLKLGCVFLLMNDLFYLDHHHI